MLQQGYMSVLEAGNADELRDEIVRFSGSLGFQRVTASVIVDRPGSGVQFTSLNNAPDQYQDKNNDVQRRHVDPVAQHCKTSSVPIAWGQSLYVANGLGEHWEEQAAFGYATGICLALHLPQSRHFLFGLDRTDPLPQRPEELTRLVADVQLFAVHAYEAASRVLMPALQNEFPSLSPREIECLRWTMEGKTAWEVGTILGISERTAVLHVNNAAHKLDCTSKHQAVIKAMRLGLIQ